MTEEIKQKPELRLTAAKLKRFFSGPGGAKVLAAVGLVGILLLSFPEMGRQEAEIKPVSVSETGTQDYAAQLAQQLEEILGHIGGVGEIHVMVTLSRQEELVYAADVTERAQLREGQEQEHTGEQSHVILERGGEEEALVSTRLSPQVQGVIIVCSGGNDPVVAARLTEAVSAVLDIGPSRIAVTGLE